MQPETRYAKSDGINIAYQVIGNGSIDLVFVQLLPSHLDVIWELPSLARFLHRLASFSRLILYDPRGAGLSDRVSVNELPTLEQRMDDVRTVLDAVGSQRAALFGHSEGAAMAALFAATYPERTSALVLFGALASQGVGSRPTEEQMQPIYDAIEKTWGRGVDLPRLAPSYADDTQLREWWTRFQRQSASPGAVVALTRMNLEVDVRHVLPAIRVPTLVLHRADDQAVPAEQGRYVAEQVPGAKYIELPGADHFPNLGDADAVLAHVQEFLTGVRPAPEPDRLLATVLFTDIVGSTQRAAELGDRRWRDLLDGYYRLARKELAFFRGREVKTTGDGFLATFDGPARAIRCACAISDAAQPLGIQIRAGLHTGECELMGDDVGGIAVHIGARVAAQASPGEVLVSSTVKDLVAGSGIRFEDRGAHTLKGVPEEWRLFAVERHSPEQENL